MAIGLERGLVGMKPPPVDLNGESLRLERDVWGVPRVPDAYRPVRDPAGDVMPVEQVVILPLGR